MHILEKRSQINDSIKHNNNELSWSVMSSSATLWSDQAPPSVGFSRQEHWSGRPCPPPGEDAGSLASPTGPWWADAILQASMGRHSGAIVLTLLQFFSQGPPSAQLHWPPCEKLFGAPEPQFYLIWEERRPQHAKGRLGIGANGKDIDGWMEWLWKVKSGLSLSPKPRGDLSMPKEGLGLVQMGRT